MTTTTIDPGRVAALDTLTIDKGAHDTWEDGHCALEVVAWLAGEHHSDSPVCVCPAIARFVRRWNDDLPDDESRERLLRPVLPRLVGTAGDAALAERRSWIAADWLVREHAPAWLDLTPALAGHADVLRALPPVADRETARAAERAAERATDAARAAAREAAWAAVRAAASAAAWAAARAAAREAAWAAVRAAASEVASEVAWDAASAAAWDAASAAAWAAASAAASAAVREGASEVAWEGAWDAAWEGASEVAWEGASEVAWEALAPTVPALQTSALDLLDRMIEAGS